MMFLRLSILWTSVINSNLYRLTGGLIGVWRSLRDWSRIRWWPKTSGLHWPNLFCPPSPASPFPNPEQSERGWIAGGKHVFLRLVGFHLSCTGPSECTSWRTWTGEKCFWCKCLNMLNRTTPFLAPSQKQTSTVWEKFMAAITVTLRQGVRFGPTRSTNTNKHTKSGLSRLRPRDIQVSTLQLPLPQWHTLWAGFKNTSYWLRK